MFTTGIPKLLLAHIFLNGVRPETGALCKVVEGARGSGPAGASRHIANPHVKLAFCDIH